MSHELRDLLHRTTHRVPGVPPHAERPAGHQGRDRHGRRHAPTHHRSHPARPPRVLVAWQARIARLFGR